MKHDWSEIAKARLVALVEALERMEPDQIEEFRARPGTALLREWLGGKQEYDL